MSTIRGLVPKEYLDLILDFGSDFSLAQGVGGNCSIKIGDRMLIKTSGKRLSDVNSSDYFYEVVTSNQDFADTVPGQSGKPSIEVFLHALLPQKFVVHLHSTLGVALSLRARNDKRISKRLLESGVDLISYHRPGKDLEGEIRKASGDSPLHSILLQNHGVVFGDDTVKGLLQKVLYFEQFAGDVLGVEKSNLLSPGNLGQKLSVDRASILRWHVQNNWRISPDHVVFLGKDAPKELVVELSGETDLARLLRSIGENTSPLSVKGEQLLWYFNVVGSLPKLPLPALGEQESIELLSWEAEKHRVEQANRV